MSEIPCLRAVAVLSGLLPFAAPFDSQETSAAQKAKLAALLPAQTTPHFYKSDLYQYLDGAADAYHRYGLAAMVHQEYRAGDTDVTADIYDMGDPLRAFGIYAAERSPRYHFIPMGAEGYSHEGLLNFLQGNYYVKLLGFSDSGQSAATLEAAARSISARIGGSHAMPQPVPWLPARGLVERSQKYIVHQPLGHEFLAPAATAVYRLDGRETTLLVSFAPEALSHLKQTFHAAPVAGLPVEAWSGDGLLFFARARYTIVLIDPPANSGGFLNELLEALK